jgi:hypothetical protein
MTQYWNYHPHLHFKTQQKCGTGAKMGKAEKQKVTGKRGTQSG